MSHQAGFTLIELMIVVAIIAILAAIAVPAYQDYIIRTQVTEGVSLAGGARTAVTEYYANYGVYPANNSAAGLPQPGSISGPYVSSVTAAATGVIEVAFTGPKANARIHGLTLELVPYDNDGSLEWRCTSMPSRYVPQVCR